MRSLCRWAAPERRCCGTWLRRVWCGEWRLRTRSACSVLCSLTTALCSPLAATTRTCDSGICARTRRAAFRCCARRATLSPASASTLLGRNLLIYGLGGLIVPFIGIKAIDLIVDLLHLA